jgi:hypothetical protein
MKQTAVEWLFEKLPTIDKYDPYYEEIFQQAKQMEKNQIITAFCEGYDHDGDNYDKAEIKYYNETYKQD